MQTASGCKSDTCLLKPYTRNLQITVLRKEKADARESPARNIPICQTPHRNHCTRPVSHPANFARLSPPPRSPTSPFLLARAPSCRAASRRAAAFNYRPIGPAAAPIRINRLRQLFIRKARARSDPRRISVAHPKFYYPRRAEARERLRGRLNFGMRIAAAAPPAFNAIKPGAGGNPRCPGPGRSFSPGDEFRLVPGWGTWWNRGCRCAG